MPLLGVLVNMEVEDSFVFSDILRKGNSVLDLGKEMTLSLFISSLSSLVTRIIQYKR